MRHTFLFEEGNWEMDGSYFDERGNPVPILGRTAVEHGQKRWYIRGVTRLLRQPPDEFQNNYEVDPWLPGEEFTAWRSSTPTAGTLLGLFMQVDDSLLSTFNSENGEYSGHEYLLQIDERTYRSRGFSFRQGEKLSSWAVEYRRVEK